MYSFFGFHGLTNPPDLDKGGTEVAQSIGGVGQRHSLGQTQGIPTGGMQWTHDAPGREGVVVNLVHGSRLLSHDLLAGEVRKAHNAAQGVVTKAFRQNGENSQGPYGYLFIIQAHTSCKGHVLRVT